jgi:hypothetical protein
VPKKHVEMVEEEVYVVLGDVGEGDPKRWIFDIGASNQMIRLREVLTNLDTDVIGMVWFGDGYVVQIKGCGAPFSSHARTRNTGLCSMPTTSCASPPTS